MLLTLIACGGSGVTQNGQTAHDDIQLNLDGAGFGEHTATIEVDDHGGQPAVVDQVMLAPVMESHGMVVPDVTAQPAGAGRYQAKGEFFSMLGEWDMDVRVSAAGKEEVARFKIQVAQP